MVPPRCHDPEMLDRPDNSAQDLERALSDIRAVNRYLGGRRALLSLLEPFLLDTGNGALEILDVGTGSADLPVAMVQRARLLGRSLVVTALDRDPNTARIAALEAGGYPEIHVVHADAEALPFRPGSFDLVTLSLFLHHFTHEQAVRLLASFRVLARKAVLVNDLRRHLVPWAFIHIATRLTGCHPMVVHDAPLSVLRGFTPVELSQAARDANAEPFRLRRRWPFRLTLALPGAGGR